MTVGDGAARRGRRHSGEQSAYWNHNTHYHRWVLRRLPRAPARVLEVGCGDGLLLQRLAAAGYDAVGLEPDPPTAERARARLAGTPGVSVETIPFEEYDGTAGQPFHAIVFVGSLHHMRLRRALVHARTLLAPGGTLLVVGLAANRTPVEHLVEVARTPVAAVASRLHRNRAEVPAPTVDPRDSLGEIAAVATSVLPGAWIRRGLYFRYLLSWRKPFRVDVG